MSCTQNTVPLDALVELRLERVASYKDPELPYIGLEHLAGGRPKLLGTLPSSASVSINGVFAQNDILFGKLRPNLRKSLRAPFAGYCSTDILVLRARDGIRPDFAGHLFQWEPIFASAAASAAGTKMPRTSWNELKRYSVRQPESEGEQSRIAALLDTADEAIAKAEALVAKLRQVRTGLIHDLLTCGLDENGHLRDPVAHPEEFSDSPLGLVPSDWTVAPLKHFLSSTEYGISTSLRSEGVLPVLRMNNLAGGEVDLAEVKFATHEVPPSLNLREGDVLFNRTNSFEHVGKTCIWRGQLPVATFASYLVRLNPAAGKLTSELLNLVLNSPEYQLRMRRFATPAVQQVNINPTSLQKMLVAIPNTISEQERIVVRAREAARSIATEAAELDKLQAIKSGLTDDLLTGRVRVPEASP